MQSNQNYQAAPEGFLEDKGLGLTPGMSGGLTTLRTEGGSKDSSQERAAHAKTLWWEGAQSVWRTKRKVRVLECSQGGRSGRWTWRGEPLPGQAWLCKPGRRLSPLSLWELGCHWRASAWSAKVISVFQEGCSGGCLISDQVTFSG